MARQARLCVGFVSVQRFRFVEGVVTDEDAAGKLAASDVIAHAEILVEGERGFESRHSSAAEHQAEAVLPQYSYWEVDFQRADWDFHKGGAALG